MANLGALYAGGSTTTAITPATGGNLNIGSGGVGSVGNGTAPVASGTPPTMSGFPELGGGVAGGPSTSWGGGGAAVETTAQGWAGGAAGGNSNNAMQVRVKSVVGGSSLVLCPLLVAVHEGRIMLGCQAVHRGAAFCSRRFFAWLVPSWETSAHGTEGYCCACGVLAILSST